jgi:hypothetical protein
MEDYNLAVLVDAKTEYTNQLTNLCKDRMYSCIRGLFNNSKKECEVLGESDGTLSLFQKKLADIPLWTSETLQKEYEQVIITSNCEWLHELLTAVFMSHSRILSSIHSTNQKSSISLDVPSFQSFLHICYIDIARCFWKSPYLFDDTVTSYDFQRNRRDCELMIEKAIGESIRKQLPVKHILKNYLGDNFKESKDVKVEQEVCTEERDNLYNMVKRDLEQASNENKTVEETIKKKYEDIEVINECTINLEPNTEENITVNVKEEEKRDELNDFPILSKPTDLELSLDIELDGLTDVTDSLQDHGAVHGLLEDEEPIIKKAVDKELKELIEIQEKDIKKLIIKDDLGDNENVTVKKMDNPEYNFFSDALPHFVE